MRFSKAGRLSLPKRGFQMNAVTANGAAAAAEILLYGEVGFEFSARDFIQQLDLLGDVSQLDIRIASPGGLASDGITIYQALARNPAQKNVYVDSIAYSAASVIAMAASPGQLKIAFNARMMMHEGLSLMMGTASELRNEAGSLDVLNVAIAKTYAKRMKDVSVDKVREMMAATTFFGADEAIAAGLADEIFEGDEQSAPDDGEYNLVRLFKSRAQQRDSAPNDEVASDAADVELRFRWAQLNAGRAA
jgi:ATP-dependent protease ClpP protease subunit